MNRTCTTALFLCWSGVLKQIPQVRKHHQPRRRTQAREPDAQGPVRLAERPRCCPSAQEATADASLRYAPKLKAQVGLKVLSGEKTPG